MFENIVVLLKAGCFQVQFVMRGFHIFLLLRDIALFKAFNCYGCDSYILRGYDMEVNTENWTSKKI